MDEQTQEMLRAAEQAVSQLVEFCRRHSTSQPAVLRARFFLGRTSHWLLHAISHFRRALQAPDNASKS
jgi:hypothetical protein